jgi:predicted lipoprotein with Yx(FWY)xxD motif
MIRPRFITFVATLAALPLAALALSGCGGGGGSANASPPAPRTSSGRPATVGVANTGLGKILVNSKGRTLYLFQKDSGTTSACEGACATNWPPLRSTGAPTVGSGADASFARDDNALRREAAGYLQRSPALPLQRRLEPR